MGIWVCDCDADNVLEDERETDLDRVRVRVCVCEDEIVILLVCVSVGVTDDDCVGDWLMVLDKLALMLWVPVKDAVRLFDWDCDMD